MPDYTIEEFVQHSSVVCHVCGVDEVGRGALFGPVVAAAVVLDPEKLPWGIKDSKCLTPLKRKTWSQWIYQHALATGLAWVWNDIIDTVNILQATRLAMTEAINRISIDVGHLLIDGPIKLDLATPQTSVIKGDQKSLSIASASVIAKVLRDELMEQMALYFPEYQLQNNRGYPTQKHLSMVSYLGLSTYHRMSFRKG